MNMNMSVTAAVTELQDISTDSPVSWELRDDFISQKTRQVIEVVCYAALTSLECLVGIPANVINCLVFWRQGLRDRMNLCLFCLSLVDCCYLQLTLVVFPVTTFMRFYDEALSEEYYTKIFAALGSVLYGFRSTSGLIGVVIAVERCVCVVFPFRAPTLMRTRTMGIIMVMCFVLFQGSHVVFLLMYRAESLKTPAGVKWMFFPTSFYFENQAALDTFAFTVLGAAVPTACLLTVTLCTSVTVVKLRDAMAWRQQTSSSKSDSQNQQVALTAMLVVVSSVYVMTMVPFVIRQVLFLFLADCLLSRRCYQVLSAGSAVVYTFLQINNVVNVFIYYVRSTKFRLTFLKMIGRAVEQSSVSGVSTTTTPRSVCK